MQNKPVVVLLSGGLNSATMLAITLQQHLTPYLLCFDYGQRHRRELESARTLAGYYHLPEPQLLTINPAIFGVNALTAPLVLPANRTLQEMMLSTPPTYVPARNAIFLSQALALAETLQTDSIFIGISAHSNINYPDNRAEFLESFERMANLATASAQHQQLNFHFYAPLLYMDKATIIQRGTELGVPYELTWSCYEGQALACGVCDSCQIRLHGFAEASRQDPIAYNPTLRTWP